VRATLLEGGATASYLQDARWCRNGRLDEMLAGGLAGNAISQHKDLGVLYDATAVKPEFALGS
jgi:hypothetical protein